MSEEGIAAPGPSPAGGIETVGRFFRRLRQDRSDLSAVAEAVEHYETELVALHASLNVEGVRLVRAAQRLPGWHAYRSAQLDEIESIIKLLEQRVSVETQAHRKRFLEGYAKTLNTSTAEKYAEAEPSVVDLVALRIEVEHLAGKFAAGVKAMEAMRYTLRTIAEVQMKQMEDMIV